MDVKLDGYYLGVMINGLYKQRNCYDEETNNSIDNLLLRLVNENDTMKTSRKKKICFQPDEMSVIRKSLFDWRNREVQAENNVADEVIGERRTTVR